MSVPDHAQISSVRYSGLHEINLATKGVGTSFGCVTLLQTGCTAVLGNLTTLITRMLELAKQFLYCNRRIFFYGFILVSCGPPRSYYIAFMALGPA